MMSTNSNIVATHFLMVGAGQYLTRFGHSTVNASDLKRHMSEQEAFKNMTILISDCAHALFMLEDGEFVEKIPGTTGIYRMKRYE